MCLLDNELSTTKLCVYGDSNAEQVLECLQCVAIIYGEQTILLQYITHIKELVSVQKSFVMLIVFTISLGICQPIFLDLISYHVKSCDLNDNISIHCVSFPSGPTVVLYYIIYYIVCSRCLVVRVVDLRPRGHGFEDG